MSTNIQNGFKFKDGMTMYEISEHLTTLKPKLLNLARTTYQRLVIEDIVAFALTSLFGIELFSSFNPPYVTDLEGYEGKNLSNLSLHIITSHRDQIRKMDDNNPYCFTPDLDLGCKVCIFPLEHKTLGLFAGGLGLSGKDHEMFMRQPWVQDYAYWDSTDPDETVPPAEWKQRELDWDEALPGIGIPKNTGLIRELVDPLDAASNIPTPDDIYNWLTGKLPGYIEEGMAQHDISKNNILQRLIKYDQE